MTNEELAVLAKSGNSEYLEKLWNNVVRFVRKRAGQILAISYRDYSVELDDLVQEAYFAFLKAVKSYNPSGGKTFVGWLDYYLRNCFARITGYDRKTKQIDQTRCCESLDAPIMDASGNRIKLDLLQDPESEQALNEAEECALAPQLHNDLERALSLLPEDSARILRMRFYFELTQEQTAQIMGMKRSQVASIEHAAFIKIRKSGINCRLEEWLSSL